METREIVIWAHSECRSTMSLFREIKRQAGVPVTISLWKYGQGDDVRQRRELDGQRIGEYDDLGLISIGEDYGRGRALLEQHLGEGVAHIFCVYQVSPVYRRLIAEAKSAGCKVFVYAEAPNEMCVGVKAWLKRVYYRFVLPGKVGDVAKHVDLFFCQSGKLGQERVLRLGWRREQVVPFGYASPPLVECEPRGALDTGDSLKILHTGLETPYRDVGTLKKAVARLKSQGRKVELVCTCGTVPLGELERLYKWADVMVACGINEPWGMRVNDAIHAGLPVVVSSGMGVKMIVEETGCGCVYKQGNATALADALARFAADPDFRAKCRQGVLAAKEKWLPAPKAKEMLSILEKAK